MLAELNLRESEKEWLLNFIFENSLVHFSDQGVKLKSGRVSFWYINWRTASEDVFLIDQLTEKLLYIFSPLDIETFYGVPEGATKLAIILQYKWAKSRKDYKKGKYVLAMGRGKVKDHGMKKDRFFLGIPKSVTAVIEDVVTTGFSLLKEIEKLSSLGINVRYAIALTDRQEKCDEEEIEKVLERKQIAYIPLLSAEEILREAWRRRIISGEMKRKIEEYYEKFGKKKIRLEQ